MQKMTSILQDLRDIAEEFPLFRLILVACFLGAALDIKLAIRNERRPPITVTHHSLVFQIYR